MQSKLKAKTVAVPSINVKTIQQMYNLYETYYTQTNYQLFCADLLEKDIVLFLFDEDGKIQGFTTLEIITTTYNRQKVRTIYSGDTIINHVFWGEQTLPLAWCKLAGNIKAKYPNIPLYWFLIVKGHRTYRYLNIFSKQYYPNRKTLTPNNIQSLINHLARIKFQNNYDSCSGLIKYSTSRGSLRQEWMNGKSFNHPEANFFHQKNPNAISGDELTCITELTQNNLRSFAKNSFVQGLQDG